MIRKDCVSLIEHDDCRSALEQNFGDAGYRTCYERYCPNFEGDRPHLCDVPVERALALDTHDARWEEFYTFVLAGDHEWAEPMPKAAYRMMRNKQNDDGDDSGAIQFTQSVELTGGQLAAQQFAGAMHVAAGKYERVADDQ